MEPINDVYVLIKYIVLKNVCFENMTIQIYWLFDTVPFFILFDAVHITPTLGQNFSDNESFEWFFFIKLYFWNVIL